MGTLACGGAFFETAAFSGTRTAPALTPVDSTGTLTVKVDPTSFSLWAVNEPPINSHICRLMLRPSPVPPNFRVVEASAWANGSNMRSNCSSVIPMPLSLTWMTSQSISDSVSRSALISTVPRVVNLAALLSRLRTTC